MRMAGTIVMVDRQGRIIIILMSELVKVSCDEIATVIKFLILT